MISSNNLRVRAGNLAGGVGWYGIPGFAPNDERNRLSLQFWTQAAEAKDLPGHPPCGGVVRPLARSVKQCRTSPFDFARGLALPGKT